MSTKKPSKPRKPIYFEVRRLVDPQTREIVGALVPRYACDRRAMRERGFSVGTELRAEIKKARNPGFHRLAHVIGALVVDNLDEFKHLDAHEAIKRLQGETGVCCEERQMEIPGLGKITFTVPRSLSFDEMEEDDFRRLVAAILDRLSAKYWQSMSPEAIETLVQIEMGKEGQWEKAA